MDEHFEEPQTAGEAYSERLNGLQSARWKRWLPVQAPYRWNMRRQLRGSVLDVGCGNGRNLKALGSDSVGVDHNPYLVATCREQGLTAVTVEEFFADPASFSAPFDSLLAAHLLEHLEPDTASDVLEPYIRWVKPGGRVMLITPQERGFASDETHTVFTDFEALEGVIADLGLREETRYSFPFPRRFGTIFIYNEFVTVATKP